MTPWKLGVGTQWPLDGNSAAELWLKLKKGGRSGQTAGNRAVKLGEYYVLVGWLAEEFAAVSVPWEPRTQRTREYLEAMKRLWTEEEPEFKGEFCGFPKAARTRNHGKNRTRRSSLVARAGRHSSGWVKLATVGSA